MGIFYKSFGIVNDSYRIICLRITSIIFQKSSYHLKNLIHLFSQLPKKHRVFITSLAVLLLIILLFPSTPSDNNNENSSSLEVGKRYQVALPLNESGKTITETASTVTNALHNRIHPPTDIDMTTSAPAKAKKVKAEANDEKFSWQTAKVRSGDSLARILKRLGFSAQTTYALSTAEGDEAKLLKNLNVGDILRIATNDEKQLTALEYPLSKTKTLFIYLTGNNYHARTEEKTVEIQQAFTFGTIKSNFWNAGITAGLTDNQIINFANIFNWDIDFSQDIRKGDSFHIIYEKKFVEGEYIGTGNIIAAEFINQSEPFQAIRFTDGEYYTPSGKSMRKAFLRAPVNFKYISSSFKPRRFHPVQKRWKAHRGIDYAAKTGTPVVAAGNGKVVRAKYDKYNGNHVFIQHGNGIETKYLHFSKRAVKKGQRVKQGQVIGYVGSTGLAAGPHLHYEFLVNGVHRNPKTVKLPDAMPINKKYKAEFSAIATKQLKALSGSKQAQLAMENIGNGTITDE